TSSSDSYSPKRGVRKAFCHPHLLHCIVEVKTCYLERDDMLFWRKLFLKDLTK
ncbi:Hypothetical predicted protein, partial [Podarcis lilfordi]